MARVMVLAAGYGTRLQPLTSVLPKPMVPLGDRPLVEQLLLQLREQGFSSAVLNTHHLPQAFDSVHVPGISLHLSHEPEILGSAGGIAAAKAHLEPPCIVWNGDIWTEPRLARLQSELRQDAVCLLVAPAQRGGSVGLDAAGRVVRLRGERFGVEVRAADYVGILALSRRAWDLLPARGCLVGDLCLPLLRAREAIGTCWHTEPWFDVGSGAGYLSANLAWLRGRGAWIAPTAQLGAAVRCSESVVGDHAQLTGTGALERCVVWPGARARTPLTDSIVYGQDAVWRVTQ